MAALAASDEKHIKEALRLRAAECEYLLGADGYFFSTIRVAATHEFLVIWHILKYHAPFPKTNKGIFRAITIDASQEFKDALKYISEKRTVNATSLTYNLRSDDNKVLPYDRVHQIRKTKIEVALQTNGNKIDLIYMDTKTLNDIVANVAIAQTTKDFGQLHVMRVRREHLDVAVLLCGLFYSHIYPIVFPWTEDVYIAAKCKTARDCNKTFDIFVAECGADKFNFADALLKNAGAAADFLAVVQKKYEEITANDSYDADWVADFL